MASIRSGIGENMEDRYLFKAKRIDDGEWIVGYLYRLSENNPPFIMLRKYGESYEVDEHTICQCTGLKDKNGKLIWEKDIIRCKLGKVIVLWDEAQWKVKKCDEVFIWYKDLYFWVSDRNAEVIGNIFDNKELSRCYL